MDAVQNGGTDIWRDQVEEFFAEKGCAFLTEIFATRPVDKSEGCIKAISTNEVGLAFHHFAVELLAPLQSLLSLFTLGHINNRTDIPEKLTVWAVTGTTSVQHPSVYAVVPSEPIFRFERYVFFKGGNVSVQNIRKIVGMNTFSPTVSQFLFQSSAGKFQPATVAVRESFSVSVIQIITGEESAISRKRRSLSRRVRMPDGAICCLAAARD